MNLAWSKGASSALALVLTCVSPPSLLVACGGGDSEPVYDLVIEGLETVTTANATAFISGTSFLPAGSTCPNPGGSCSAPVFGVLGPYLLEWANETTGARARINATWICNCDNPSQSSWMTTVPLAPGVNRITVTMSDSARTSQDIVTITRD